MNNLVHYCRFINLFIFRKPFVPLSNSVVIHLCSGQSEVTRRMEEMTASEREEHNAEGTGVLPRAEIVRDEHPLSLGKTSVWNQYFQVNLPKINNSLLFSHVLIYTIFSMLRSRLCTHIFFCRLLESQVYEITSITMESNTSCNVNQLHDDSKFLFDLVLHRVSKICLTFPIFHYKSKIFGVNFCIWTSGELAIKQHANSN
jgi:hypothetical protein